jgi:SEC-C motif-containing protein
MIPGSIPHSRSPGVPHSSSRPALSPLLAVPAVVYRRAMPDTAACPCGSGAGYRDCCGPLHSGEMLAPTPERLMRSRYSAFALGDAGYLLRTWHPRTRPAELRLDADLTWLSLQVVAATGDTVEFIARYRGPSGRGFQREVSRFVRHGDRWFYLDGVAP